MERKTTPIFKIKKELTKDGYDIEKLYFVAWSFRTIKQLNAFQSTLHNNGIREIKSLNYGNTSERKCILAFDRKPDNRIPDIANLFGGVKFIPR